jgi:hypothetical protein
VAPEVSPEEFLKVPGLRHLEVFNGNRPRQTSGAENLWDSVLSAPDGRLVFAVASDDNHYKKSKVGRGWIMVESPALTPEDIKRNISDGNFYATTGIIINDLQISDTSIFVDTVNGSEISFIGYKGKVVNSVRANKAYYKFDGNERYIRIKIKNKEGKMAWTQPRFIN